MATLKVDEAAFTRERSVVKEERRQKIENQPYGRLAEIVYDQAFKVHPYKHQVIGSMADLEAATIDDVREFHETYYVPENAVLVIAGDFDPKETLEAGRAVLRPRPEGRQARPARHPEGAGADEGARASPSTRTCRSRRWWSRTTSPTTGIPDSYPLHIASKVLSDGQSSRIYQSLVYEKRLALARVRQGQHHRAPEPVLRDRDRAAGRRRRTRRRRRSIAELDRLRTEPISEHELERTKNQFARDYILGRLTVQHKAGVLAHAAVIHNDLTHGRRRVRHLHEHHRRRRPARGEDLLHAGEPAGAHDPAAGERADAGAVTRMHRRCLSRIARQHDRCGRWRARSSWRRSPRAGRPSGRRGRSRRGRSSFPPYEIRTLANGLRVVVVRQTRAAGRQPAAAGARRRGAGSDGQAGRGDDGRGPARSGDDHAVGASRLPTSIDYVGGALGTGAGTDLSFVNAIVMKDSFDFGARPAVGRRAQPGVRRRGARAAARAGAVRAEGELSRIPTTSRTRWSSA